MHGARMCEIRASPSIQEGWDSQRRWQVRAEGERPRKWDTGPGCCGLLDGRPVPRGGVQRRRKVATTALWSVASPTSMTSALMSRSAMGGEAKM